MSPRPPQLSSSKGSRHMSTPEVIAEQESLQTLNADYTERYGFHDAENYLYKAPKGLTRELVAKISEFKNEPGWMTDFRLKSYDYFMAREQPTWGSPMLAEVDYDDIHYFVRASERLRALLGRRARGRQEDLRPPRHPGGRAQVPAGVGAQYESEVVYHQVNEQLEARA